MVSIFHKNDRVTLSDQSPSQHRAVERHPAVVFADDASELLSMNLVLNTSREFVRKM